MLRFTICFILQGDKILLLNREKPAWMGRWNGVGGKIEPGETPQESILREIREETDLTLEEVSYKGIVTWSGEGVEQGGMHLFLAYLPEDYIYETPKKIREGILDWKSLDWVLDPRNEGVASNIPYFLPVMLQEKGLYDHHCRFEQGCMTGYEKRPLKSVEISSALPRKLGSA
ncbi:NUDIX hydrolase [Thermicanus aegyptius]|uniref:NUDIX hydrolase n=1 Tax=Thermicanus aegyptius TaxID=94009 RepID=UPI0003FD628A|nr:8-oxo-dGTP diphosphatase [Thermicanus aegyptius]